MIGGAGGAGGASAPDAGDAAAGGAGGRAAVDAGCSNALGPDILLMLDGSNSMNQALDGTTCPAGSCTSKWQLVSGGIDQALAATDASVSWGLKLFASSGTCTVTPEVTVPIARSQHAVISAAIAMRLPAGSTPTRLAADASLAYMQTLTDAAPKAMVLITDGAPNCPADATNITLDDTAGAGLSLATASSAGFPTFVIGIGAVGSGQQSLNQLALQGGKASGDLQFEDYPASTAADVAAALTTIAGLATCP
jgi:hypothetical protein